MTELLGAVAAALAIDASGPTLAILFPATKIEMFRRGSVETPSISVPQRRMKLVLGGGAGATGPTPREGLFWASRFPANITTTQMNFIRAEL
jgi:hypothetical protein